ncbi:MAG: four helix bundle protein [Candidatus Margulisbacteria bacterium]|nr:four helix bundle protein [Candidatus Margulisiibacteriota bacterium]
MTFDFEKLSVYQKARLARKELYAALAKEQRLDRVTADQLRRASLSVILNIAEGTGKASKADKKNFYTVARGSIYETVAILDILLDDGILTQESHQTLYSLFEEISKMLLGLIKSLS